MSHDDCSCELLRGGDVGQFNATHIGSPPLQLPLAKQIPLLDPCNS